MLGRPVGGQTEDLSAGSWPDRLAEARRKLNADEVTFAAVLEQLGLEIDVRALAYWSHWITPSAERRRYDTRFFVAWLPRGQVAEFDAKETVEQVWRGPGQAVCDHHLLALFLAPPTQRTLEELQPILTPADLDNEASAPVPPIMPKLMMDDNGIRIVLPWDETYAQVPGDGIDAAPLPRQAKGPSRIMVRWPGQDEASYARAQAILQFWFGLGCDGLAANEANAKSWFAGGSTFDDACRAFEDDVKRAMAGDYDDWSKDPQRDLARIILLDQFSRNIYRGTPQAFAQDARAFNWASDAIDAGRDQQVPPVLRVFFYMPLMHSEDRAAQDRQVELFRALVDDVPPAHRASYERNLDYGERHRAIVDRFGRYPHRNEILGRASTPQEIEFLKQPGSGF